MDPQKLFFDRRNTGFCVHCGREDSTRDHVPSKVLLDEPFPENLPLVPCCEACNNGFSDDEPYLACLIECILAGSTEPDRLSREKVKRIFTKRPHISVRIDSGRRQRETGGIWWNPDRDRVRKVVLKLARGHVAYETGEPQLGEPSHLWFAPLCTLSTEQAEAFEILPGTGLWPEVGSRAFFRATEGEVESSLQERWLVIQRGRYRYLVSELRLVRIVLSEYLACEVSWD